MTYSVGVTLIGIGLSFALSLPAASAMADVIEVGSIKPFCVAPFLAVPVKGECVIDNQKLAQLNSAAACKGPGIMFKDGQCVVEGKAPAPMCTNAIPDLVVKGEGCVIDRKVPRSATGDYVGDYFLLKAGSHDSAGLRIAPGTYLKVLSQQPLGIDDRLLTVVATSAPGVARGFAPLPGAEVTTVKASDLIEVGATRMGWTYGVLALPFKMYPGDKGLASGLSFGPYVGRRWGAPGSAYTIAVAATIGSVKGEVRDAENNITSTPDLQAFSLAAGVMWDISKSQGIKPFKIGLFVGSDSVSDDDIVKFKHNRKPWLAFQIGFDFTDN